MLLARLQADRPDRLVAITEADQTVSAEITKLLAPVIEDLVARGENGLAEITRVAATLRCLSEAAVGVPSHRLPDELAHRVDRLLGTRACFFLSQFDLPASVTELVSRWRAARQQLRTTPDTLLPEV